MLCVIIMLMSIFCNSACYKDFYYHSLPDYIERIDTYHIGFSEYELDFPTLFLPSETFLTDFTYIEGEYYFYEEDPWKMTHSKPSTALLVLRYDEGAYEVAKDDMLKNIPSADDTIYKHQGYIFYRNAHFASFLNNLEVKNFLKWFTMASYNDEKNILCFIGFYDCVGVDEKFYADPEGNWGLFIDTYYGEYYNFKE